VAEFESVVDGGDLSSWYVFIFDDAAGPPAPVIL